MFKKNVNVIVMSRSNAVQFCNRFHHDKSVIISISTPYHNYESKPFMSEDNKVISILNLIFDDFDTPAPELNITENELITKDDAKKIKSFVEKYKDTTIIVHCDAGMSRSAGVAAAIMKYYNNDDSKIFDNPIYKPNMKCYRTVLNELFEEDNNGNG